MMREIEREAARLDVPISWVLEVAFAIARPAIAATAARPFPG